MKISSGFILTQLQGETCFFFFIFEWKIIWASKIYILIKIYLGQNAHIYLLELRIMVFQIFHSHEISI